MQEPTTLASKMRARADQDKLPDSHELRLLADEFDVAAWGYVAEPQTTSVRAFMRAWARATRLWSNYSGEPLI